MAADDQRLVLVIADDSDAAPALQSAHIVPELGPELSSSNIVDVPRVARAMGDGQPAPLGAEV
jgi:hypothetical protein